MDQLVIRPGAIVSASARETLGIELALRGALGQITSHHRMLHEGKLAVAVRDQTD
jgi:hypothetical protein